MVNSTSLSQTNLTGGGGPFLSRLDSGQATDALHNLIDATQELREEAAPALATLKENLEDATAVLALPGKYRRRLRTTNMIERLIEEVRRREKVIRIFPNMDSTWRLIGAVLAERHEEWSTGRKYLDMAEFRTWKEQASKPEPEPDDSTERQPAMAT